MPKRATKRGAERTPLSGEYDVIICGASFAGLTVARQLTGSGARVLMLDRYEIGERQTSACGIPTEWLTNMGLEASAKQEFPALVVHTPHGTSRYELPWTFSTFDYRELCRILDDQNDAEFETAKVNGRTGDTVHTDRGDVSAPLIVDALGWRRILASDGGYQPPDAPLSRGLEVHPDGGADDLELWIDRRYVPAGYGWRFPAGGEERIGVGSFDPRFHVKDTTVLLSDDLERPPGALPGQLDPAQAPPGHRGRDLLRRRLGRPLPAADRRGDPHRLLLRDQARRRAARRRRRAARTAARRCAPTRAFTDDHEWKFRWMLRAQKLVPKLPARAPARADLGGRPPPLRPLGVQPLPRDRPARVRRPRAASQRRRGRKPLPAAA